MIYSLDDFETALAIRHGLTKYEAEVAAMILAGRAACPLRCYPARVVSFVAEVRERDQRRNESPLKLTTVKQQIETNTRKDKRNEPH